MTGMCIYNKYAQTLNFNTVIAPDPVRFISGMRRWLTISTCIRTRGHKEQVANVCCCQVRIHPCGQTNRELLQKLPRCHSSIFPDLLLQCLAPLPRVAPPLIYQDLGISMMFSVAMVTSWGPRLCLVHFCDCSAG